MMTIYNLESDAQQLVQLFCYARPGKKQVDTVSGFKREDLSSLLLATRLALTIVLPILGALLLGRYLGRIYGYEVFFIITALSVALVGGFRQAIRMLLKK
jgi:hypothetical protein